MTEIYSVGPLTTGSGLNITVWSYVDQLNISVLSDGATLLDPHELTDAMIDAFIEIRRAAGLSEELTVIENAMRLIVGSADSGDFSAWPGLLRVHPRQELLDRPRGVVRRAATRSRSRMRAGRAGSRHTRRWTSIRRAVASANSRPSGTGMIESSCAVKHEERWGVWT